MAVFEAPSPHTRHGLAPHVGGVFVVYWSEAPVHIIGVCIRHIDRVGWLVVLYNGNTEELLSERVRVFGVDGVFRGDLHGVDGRLALVKDISNSEQANRLRAIAELDF